MWFALGFALACALGAYIYGTWLLAGAVLCAFLAALCWACTRWQRPFRVGCAIFLGMAVGLAWFMGFDFWKLDAARQADGKTFRTRIYLSDYTWDTNYGIAGDGRVTIYGSTYNVRVYFDEDYDLKPGDSIWGDFRFRFTTVGGSREPSWLQGDGIFLIAYQQGILIPEGHYLVQSSSYPAVWRQELMDVLNRAFPDDVEGFARALLLGDRTGIDYETNMTFEVSGVSHVIAVSGMHVSILFGLVYLLTGRRRILTAVIGIPVLVLFAAMAGFTPSITRACIMQCILLLSMVFSREYDQMTSLGTSVLVMLAINPMVITSVSFQLSAGCMAGIFLFAAPIRRWLMDESRLGRWNGRAVQGLSTSVAVTLGAMVFTMPLTAWHFGSVSLIGILTNLVTLWLISVVFYGVLLVCLFGTFSTWMAGFLGLLLEVPVQLVLWLTDILSQVPLAAVYTKSVYIVLWLIFVYALVGMYLLLRQQHAGMLSAAILGGLCLSLTLSWMEPLLDECRVTMLDVGQGQSVILQSGGKTFLVDCGGDYSDDAADLAAETLLSQGIDRIDGLILTHYDIDHAGGAEYLLARLDADCLYLPYAADHKGVADKLTKMTDGTVVTVLFDQIIDFGDGKITLFAPVSYDSGNESGMCVLFQTENCDILITGDLSFDGERILVQRHELPQLELLVAGHHGSKNSTSVELLEETRPEYVLISAGRNNRYGHPASATLERLLQFGCNILCTKDNGTIMFRR